MVTDSSKKIQFTKASSELLAFATESLTLKDVKLNHFKARFLNFVF